MRPFDLQEALLGAPICTKEKEKAIIKAIELGKSYQLVVDVETDRDVDGRKCKPYSQIRHFTLDGKYEHEDLYFLDLVMKDDLFMVEEKEEETFNPFDHIIGKLHENGEYWCIDFYSEKIKLACRDGKTKIKYFGLSGNTRNIMYSEVHHYEEWMKRYIGSHTPFNEWKKGGDE